MASTYTAPEVAYSEVTDPEMSPQEQDGPDGFRATRVLKCAWSDRLSLARQILGAWRITNGDRTFVVGDNYPHRNRVYAASIPSIRPFGTPSGGSTASWSHALLTVEYSERTYSLGIGDGSESESGDDEPDIAEETVDFEGQVLTLPGLQLYWEANTPVDEVIEAPTKIINFGVWTLTYTEEGDIPDGLQSNYGKVNEDSVISNTLGWTFAPETLLYMGCKNRRSIVGGVGGEAQAWTRTLEFRFNRQGWNKFYRGGNATPQSIYSDAAASVVYKPYETVNFATGLGI